MIKFGGARHCNSRARFGRVRGPRVAFLANPLARHGEACRCAPRLLGRTPGLGTRRHPRTPRAARLAAPRTHLRPPRAALRLRTGAFGDAMPATAHLPGPRRVLRV